MTCRQDVTVFSDDDTTTLRGTQFNADDRRHDLLDELLDMILHRLQFGQRFRFVTRKDFLKTIGGDGIESLDRGERRWLPNHQHQNHQAWQPKTKPELTLQRPD